MEPGLTFLLQVLSREIQGKKMAMPIEYYELCLCHPQELSRPTKGILGRDLVIAADRGCLICKLVRRGLETALGTVIDETYNIVYRLKQWFGLKIRYMFENDWDTQRTYQLYAARDSIKLYDIRSDVTPRRSYELLPGYDVYADSFSRGCLARIQALLLECRETHPHCQSKSVATLPTRVLYIGDREKSPNLLCTQDEIGEYVALSHCWGPAQTLTTTIATLSERQLGIDWQLMPKTFQDAIRVARELGFDFIWIDSLCIMQDDFQDWEREAAQMGFIYENAALTIAASVASSDEAGFLRKRSEHLSQTFWVEHVDLEHGQCEFHIRKHLPGHKRHDISSYVRDSFRSNIIGPAAPLEPLDYRAWTFQERLVSRRLLSFCEKEFEWDCLSSTNCECDRRRRDFNLEGWDARTGSMRQVYQSLKQDHLSGSDALLWGRTSHQLSEDMARRFRALQRGEHVPCGRCPECVERWELTAEEKLARAYTLWRTHLVPSYSLLRLTKEMDRLPALQAVARSLHPLCGDYIAGMWKDDLTVGIAWQAGAFGSVGPQPGRPVAMRAPSWSWASIEGAVDHSINFEDEFVAVCDLALIRTFPEDCEGFSNVEFAVAGMRGHLLPAILDVRKRERNENENLGGQSTFQYSCSIGEGRFSMYPDCILDLVDGEVERSVAGIQEEFSCPIQVLAYLVVRKHRSATLESGDADSDADGDNDLCNMYNPRRLVFIALDCYQEDETDFPYKRIGILPFVDSTKLPKEWFARWPPSIFLLA